MKTKYFPATIPCDWGYLWDYLSIFEVKMKKKQEEKTIRNFLECCMHIQTQLDEKLFHSILSSPEYKNLVEVNSNLFDLVDASKNDSVLASTVDAGVWSRFLAKKALQEKFFPETELKEQKFNYTN
jgi:hypothetical protein